MTATQINTPSAAAAGRVISAAANNINVEERFAFNNRYYIVKMSDKRLKISDYQYEVLKKLYELNREGEYIFTRDGYWSLLEVAGYFSKYMGYYYDKVRELHEKKLIERVPAEEFWIDSKMKIWVLTELGWEVLREIAAVKGDKL